MSFWWCRSRFLILVMNESFLCIANLSNKIVSLFIYFFSPIQHNLFSILLMDIIQGLPLETLFEVSSIHYFFDCFKIFLPLDLSTIGRTSSVNKQWNSVLNTWDWFWRRKYEEDFGPWKQTQISQNFQPLATLETLIVNLTESSFKLQHHSAAKRTCNLQSM